MAYNTGNAVGSTDARDLYDNAVNLDTAVNSMSARWTDRLGISRPSWSGMVQYADIGPYAAGIEITGYNEIFLHEGEYYRAAASTTLPYTTTGSWSDDVVYFVSVGDAVLRQELETIADTVIGTYRNAVNCKQYGGLQLALSDSDTLGKVIIVTDDQSITDDVTVANRAVACEFSTGIITIASNKTLTINGPFQAGLYQCFDGAGSVTFGSGSISEVYPEWWGAKGDGITDCSAELQLAVQAVEGNNPSQLVLNSVYAVSQPSYIAKTINILGCGRNSGIINNTTTEEAAFIVDGSGSAFPYANFSTFSDFSIVGNGTTSGSGIKYNDRAAYLQFNRLYLEGNNHGIWHYAPPNSGGTARATWGSSYGANFTAVYAKANYGKGFYDDSTDNPDPGVQFNSCISEQNGIGVDWGSGEVSVVGGVYQADTAGEMVFRSRASLLNVYFEVSTADYSGNPMVELYGYGSSVQGCTFNSNATANVKHISYHATTIIDGNTFGATGSPVGCIGIYNATELQAYTASKIFNNTNNGVTTFQSIGTAEVFYQDATGANHFSALVTTGGVTSGGKVTLGVAATGATNQISFVGYCSAALATNNSLFIDSATGKISFKNAAGTTTALY